MEVKERIMLEADDLFIRYGIKTITMDDIAKHMGISKKTIYQYFKNKNNLVEQLTALKMEAQVQMLKIVSNKSNNAIEEILNVLEAMEQMVSRVTPAVYYDLQKYHPKAWIIFKTFRDEYAFGKIKENLRRGIAEGYYRKDMDVDIIAQVRLILIDLAFSPQHFTPDRFDIRQVLIQLTDHYMHGISTLKGHKLINKYLKINEEE